MDYPRVVSALAGFLEPRKIRFGLAGAHALRAYGHGRATSDIDFVVDDAIRLELLQFAASLGYEELYASEAFSNHLHADPAWGKLDFIYLERPTADRMFGSATTIELAGSRVLLPSAEHLIAMKLAAIKDRPHRAAKDFPDILYLMQLPGVDEATVRRYFTKYGLQERFDLYKLAVGRD